MRALAILLLCVCGIAGAGGLPLRSKKVHKAVEQLQPAVVKIFGAKGFRGIYGYLTGVIVHKSGLVITRRSVTLEETEMIKCHLNNGRRYMGEIVREDPRSKMVLIRLKGDKGEAFPVARLAKAGGVKPGQFVMLIGNAYKVALGPERCAVNFGLVSAVAKIRMRQNRFEFKYPDVVILHDAMNNPGVYGGPLVNLAGEVIGISGTIVESPETNAQLHYAIPIEHLVPFIEDTVKHPSALKTYVRPEDAGNVEVERPAGYHGVRVLKSGINRATPAYVNRVLRDSPARKAGVRPDDLILKVDETRVKSWKTFQRLMSTYRAGDTVKLTIQREQEIKLFVLKLVKKPVEKPR